jgi:hypothetical protein
MLPPNGPSPFKLSLLDGHGGYAIQEVAVDITASYYGGVMGELEKAA